MILVDVNLLVYAWDRRAPLHETAVRWLDRKLGESARVGLPWECLLGFMRVVTNPRLYERPAPVSLAWGETDSRRSSGGPCDRARTGSLLDRRRFCALRWSAMGKSVK